MFDCIKEVLLTGMERVSAKAARVRKSRLLRGDRAWLIPPWIDAVAPRRQNGQGTLGERIYQALKRDIIRGFYPQGEALNESVLSQVYGASCTPIREAAARLEQDNLLRIVPNRGYFVSSPTIGWWNGIFEYCAAIEGAGAELAARRGTDKKLLDDLARLATTEYVTNDRRSYERFIAADTALHIGIARLTCNRMLIRAVSDVRCHMERLMYASIDIGYFGGAPVQEHSEIITAIFNRDVDLARRLTCDHILQSRGKTTANGKLFPV